MMTNSNDLVQCPECEGWNIRIMKEKKLENDVYIVTYLCRDCDSEWDDYEFDD